jgi:hypothetical protein
VEIIAILGLQLPPTGDGSIGSSPAMNTSSFTAAGLFLVAAVALRLRRYLGRPETAVARAAVRRRIRRYT